MVASSYQSEITFNSILKDIKGSWCCVSKIYQYIWKLKFNRYMMIGSLLKKVHWRARAAHARNE